MTINLFGRDAIADLGDEEIEEGVDKEPIPTHAFDLIIADECHRGYTAKETVIWRHAMDHFDAIKIGLTATPAAHTTSYYKDVVYRYEYERPEPRGECPNALTPVYLQIKDLHRQRVTRLGTLHVKRAGKRVVSFDST